VLPVITDLVPIQQSRMARHDRMLARHLDPARIEVDRHLMVGQMAGDGIPVALYRHQTGTGNTRQHFDIAIERRGHRHQVHLLLFQRIGNGNAGVRMLHLRPQGAAACFQPDIEFIERTKVLCLGVHPDSPPGILHVLLDHPFLPAGGHVAEVRIKQVVRRHGKETCIDDATVAFGNLVHGRAHVVVDAALGYATQGREGAGMRIEQHFMALGRVACQVKGTTRAQLGMRRQYFPVDTTDYQPLLAPVKLEGFAQLELERHKRGFTGARRVLTRAPDKLGHLRIAARVTLLADRLKQPLCRTTIPLEAVPIGLQGQLQQGFERRQLAVAMASLIVWLIATLEPFLDGVARQARTSPDLTDAEMFAEMHPPDLWRRQ